MQQQALMHQNYKTRNESSNRAPLVALSLPIHHISQRFSRVFMPWIQAWYNSTSSTRHAVTSDTFQTEALTWSILVRRSVDISKRCLERSAVGLGLLFVIAPRLGQRSWLGLCVIMLLSASAEYWWAYFSQPGLYIEWTLLQVEPESLSLAAIRPNIQDVVSLVRTNATPRATTFYAAPLSSSCGLFYLTLAGRGGATPNVFCDCFGDVCDTELKLVMTEVPFKPDNNIYIQGGQEKVCHFSTVISGKW